MITLIPLRLAITELVEKEKDWWPWDFILTYMILLRHNYENALRTTEIIVFDNAERPIEQSAEIRMLKSSTETAVSIAFKKDHFVVLIVKVKESHVEICDGLRYDTSIWNMHIVKMLTMIGCTLSVADLNHISEENEDFVELRNTIEVFTVTSNPMIEQVDCWNCGPIACAVLHDLVAEEVKNTQEGMFFEKFNASCQDEVKLLRRGIVEHYGSMIHQSKRDFSWSTLQSQSNVKPTKLNTIEIDDCDDVKSLHSSKGTGEKHEENLPVPQKERDKERFETNLSLNLRQQKSAEKCKDRFIKHMNESDVKVGDFVRIKVDARDRYLSNTAALQALVFRVHENTKAINVVTPMGILSTLGKKVRNIPVEEFSVIKRGVLDPRLFRELKEMVNILSFKIKDHELYTMRQLHEYQVKLFMNEEDIKARLVLSQQRETVRSELNRKINGCKCKGGTCTHRCGCKKKGLSCNSNCTCGGVCEDT